jgi:hypothetical protein
MDELDLSWLEETRKILDTPDYLHLDILIHPLLLNKTPLSHIQIIYIYVNPQNEIQHIAKKKHKLTTENVISKEHVLKIIQSGKTHCGKKYKLNDIIQYNLDIEPDKIKWFSKDPSPPFGDGDNDNEITTPLTPINYIDEIEYNSSLPLFHPLNELYVIYVENPAISGHIKPSIKIFESPENPQSNFQTNIIDMAKPNKLNITKKKRHPTNHTKSQKISFS